MDSEELRNVYEARRPALEGAAAALQHAVCDSTAGFAHIDRIGFRVKSVESFVAKAVSGYAHPLIEIEDQIAGRILVFFTTDVDVVSDNLRSLWVPVEEKIKRPERDAEFGYECYHQVFAMPEHVKPEGWASLDGMPETFEMQVRTLFQHAYAEPQHDFGYKESGDLSSDQRRQLAWIAASAWGADRAFAEIQETMSPSGG